jgi:hypothetical protein
MSNQAIGSAGRLAIVEETVFGQVPASPTPQILNFTYGESLMAEADELVSETVDSHRAIPATRNGLFKVMGSVPFELGVDGMAILFKGVAGAVTTVANTTAGLYDHTFKREKTLPSFSIEKGFTDIGQYLTYTGLKINTFKLNLTPNELAKGSMDFMGSGLITAQTPMSASPTAYAMFPFANFEGGMLEGGSAPKLLNLSFEIKNNLFVNNIVGSRFADSIGAGRGEITGEITVQFQDLTYFTKWLNETEETLKVTYQTSVASQAGKKIEILFPRIKFNGSASPAIANKEGVTLSLKFRAILDTNPASPTYGTDFLITITDTQATV